MKSPFYFLIKAKGEHYTNKITVAGQDMIVNSTLSNHMHVNRFAEVIYTITEKSGCRWMIIVL